MATFNTDSRVASPCIDLCTLDDDDICVGCFRSIDEICAWGGASDDQRRLILQATDERRRRNDQSG